MLRIVIRLILNLFITLLFEVPLARFLGVRDKKKLATVLLINCATNPAVNFTLTLIPFLGIYTYSTAILIVLELFSFATEGIVYKLCGIKRAFFLSLILNLVSYFGGQLLHRML